MYDLQNHISALSCLQLGGILPWDFGQAGDITTRASSREEHSSRESIDSSPGTVCKDNGTVNEHRPLETKENNDLKRAK